MKQELKKMRLDSGEVLAYREAGDGNKLLLFIHGNMSAGIHFMPLVKRLPSDYKAYIVDLRGFGDSTYHNQIHTIKNLSDDIYEFINKLGLRQITLVGWSAGGSICLQLAADYSELVNKIVLISAVGHGGVPLFRKDEQGNILKGQVYEDKAEMAEDSEVAPCLAAIRSQNADEMSTLWNMAIYTNQKPGLREGVEYINATLKQRNLVDIYWALAQFNISHQHNGYIEGNGLIDHIKAPVLSIWGEKDVIISENTVRETVKALGENAKMLILKDSGHSPMVDYPDLLIERLIEFIEA